MLIIWNCSNWWKNATLSCSKWSLEFSASFMVLKSLFNIMSNIDDKKLGKINFKTYSPIQGIKYGLKVCHPLKQNQCVKESHRESRVYAPINPTLTRNMRSLFSLFNAKQKTDKKKLVKCWRKFNLRHPDCATNKTIKLDTIKQTEKAQNHHQQVLAEAYSRKRLSAQSENPINTKDGQEETIALDAERLAEHLAEPIQVDEQLTVSRKSYYTK